MQLGRGRRRTVETSAREDVPQRSVRCLGGGARILRNIAERSAARQEAACRIIVSSQHLQQAGLACSVAAYQPDFVPWRDGEARRRTARVARRRRWRDHGPGARRHVTCRTARRSVPHQTPRRPFQMKRVLVVIAILVAAAACGGGGGTAGSTSSGRGQKAPAGNGAAAAAGQPTQRTGGPNGTAGP